MSEYDNDYYTSSDSDQESYINDLEEIEEYEMLQNAYESMKNYTECNYLPLCENINIHNLGELLYNLVNN